MARFNTHNNLSIDPKQLVSLINDAIDAYGRGNDSLFDALRATYEGNREAMKAIEKGYEKARGLYIWWSDGTVQSRKEFQSQVGDCTTGWGDS